MRGSDARVEEGVDVAWLRAQAARDPLPHAFALWDLEHAPDRVRFVTLRRGPAPAAYLLIWTGNPKVPVVHWTGSDEADGLLARSLPPRPFIAVVPVEAEEAVRKARGPLEGAPLLGMVRDRAPLPPASDEARRLRAADTEALRDLARENPGGLTAAYGAADPERDPIWGVFRGQRLLGVARAQVTLPSFWVVGGVFTVPEARARGVGTAATRAVVRAADGAGARTGLWVRAENATARRVYERLGFRVATRRIWVDAGAGWVP